jgi:hypothetical protein
VQVTCLAKRWSHHTTSGGYDRLAIAVGANIVKRESPKGTLSCRMLLHVLYGDEQLDLVVALAGHCCAVGW